MAARVRVLVPYREVIYEALKETTDRQAQDELLDKLIDYSTLLAESESS